MDTDVTLRERIADEVERAIDRADGVPARWGVDDCTLWIADILRAATGKDPAADFRGKYSDRTTAYELIGPRGLAFGIQKRAKRFGWQPLRRVEIAKAEYGDLGIARLPGVQACVMKVSGRFWIGRSDRGVAYLANNLVTAAWRVG